MPLNPPQDYRKTAFTHRRGIRADQPVATDVLSGTLYYVTDEGIVERSDGTNWQTYGSSGAASTYTPGLTNVANLDASTAYECQYLRIDNTVTVSGRVDIDPTLTATSTKLGIDLPIPSNFGAAEDCAGVSFSPTIFGQGAAILADTTNDRAQLEFISSDVTNQPMYFVFSYQII